MDQENLLEQLIAILTEHKIHYCVIGGQAVNAYVEPVVTLDLDIVIAVDQVDYTVSILGKIFKVENFSHSINISSKGSDLRVQIQLDPRYALFPDNASIHNVLGLNLPVANLKDVLRGKIWAIQDINRRASKRQKDLADIARILEVYPDLRDQVPNDILARLF